MPMRSGVVVVKDRVVVAFCASEIVELERDVGIEEVTRLLGDEDTCAEMHCANRDHRRIEVIGRTIRTGMRVFNERSALQMQRI